MILPEYLADIAKEFGRKAEGIRRDFSTHKPSSGQNKEALVSDFLKSHFPEKFGISTGLIFSCDGIFSKQADVVIVDRQNNAPLYGSLPNPQWPIESVYALIEVKTSLSPTELKDAFDKGRRFKSLKREFCKTQIPQLTMDSLFVVWGFESPSPAVLKKNIVDLLNDIPRDEQPDFIVVPDSVVVKAGSYLDIATFGHVDSPYRRELQKSNSEQLKLLGSNFVEVDDYGVNALFAWYVWFDSWLRQAGSRFVDPIKYIPKDKTFGKII